MLKPLFGTACITVKQWPPMISTEVPLNLGQKPGFDCWREGNKLIVKADEWKPIAEAREAARVAKGLEDKKKGWLG